MEIVIVLRHVLTVKENMDDREIAYESIMEETYQILLENTSITEKDRCSKYIELATEYRSKLNKLEG